MQRSVRDNKATKGLSRHIEKGAPGRLCVGHGHNNVSVYLMNGQILSAEAADDTQLLLRRLVNAGLLPRVRAEEMSALVELGERVFGTIRGENDPSAME